MAKSKRTGSVRNPTIVFHRAPTNPSVIDMIIRLEARFQPNFGFTLRRVLSVFTRSAITHRMVCRCCRTCDRLISVHGDRYDERIGDNRTVRAVGTDGDAEVRYSVLHYRRPAVRALRAVQPAHRATATGRPLPPYRRRRPSLPMDVRRRPLRQSCR